MNLSHALDLIGDNGVQLVMAVALVLGAGLRWIGGWSRSVDVQQVIMMALGVAAWAVADPGSETRQGLALWVGGVASVLVTVLLLDEISMRFTSPEQRAQAPRKKGGWIPAAVIGAMAAAIWIGLPEAAPERAALVWIVVRGPALAAALWGLFKLGSIIWRAALAVGE